MFHDQHHSDENHALKMTRKSSATTDDKRCTNDYHESYEGSSQGHHNPLKKKFVRSNSQVITGMFQVDSHHQAVRESPSTSVNPSKLVTKKQLRRTDSFAIITAGHRRSVDIDIPTKPMVVTGALVQKPPVSPLSSVGRASSGTPKIRTPVKQKTLASFVQKHFINMHNKLHKSNHNNNNYRDPSVESLSRSCPNLAQKSNEPNAKSKVRITLSTDTSLEKRHNQATNDLPSSLTHKCYTTPKHLEVPNMFITSQTHSKPITDDGHYESDEIDGNQFKVYRHSAPELRAGTTTDTADLDKHRMLIGPREITQQSGVYYRDGYLSQILDFLFVGNVESAYHERLLCKLKIEGMVDVSCVSPDDVPAHKKKECPCTCPLDTRHLRPSLRINLNNIEMEDMYEYFEEINRFIEGFRKSGKRVLVYCIFGKCQAPAIIIQYIMTYRNLNLRKTFDLVKNHRPEIQLNEMFQTALKRVERRLRQRGHSFKTQTTRERAMTEENAQHETAVDSHRKIAWAECQ